MKIYPGTHKIISADSIDKNNDVQIAYITNKVNEVEPSISTSFTEEKSEAVVPYEIFNRSDIVLFDSVGNIIDDTYNYLVRLNGSSYQYVPKNIVSTIRPTEFSYRVIAKRNEKLNKLKNYYLSIKCLNDKFDDSDPGSLLDTIRSIFLYASDRKLCPNYIIVNENDQNKFYYDEDEDNNIDFCFIKSIDGKIVNGTDILNLPSSLDHTNLWIIVKDDNFPNSDNPMTLYDYDGKDYNFNLEHILYDSINYDSAKLKLFLAKRYKDNIDNNIFTLSDSYYAPLFIKEDVIHKRFIIYSTESMFSDLTTDDTNIIFEYIMQLYLRSYFVSNKCESWISDEMPDYIVSNHKMIRQLNFVSQDTYYDILDSDKDSVILDSVEIDNDNIGYSIDASDHIVFNKIQKDEQFTKPEDCISIYCHNKTIIYYKDNVYTKTSSLLDHIIYMYDANVFTVKIDNYVDSQYGINLSNLTLSKTIPSNKFSNILLIAENNAASLIYESDYYGGLILVTFSFQSVSSEDRILYDIRLRGGGLPENNKHDHQSVLDIGSIDGISYRRGGSIIIRLPVEFKKYHDRVKYAVDKHIAADAHAFIVYY